jgi:hypothetical protein
MLDIHFGISASAPAAGRWRQSCRASSNNSTPSGPPQWRHPDRMTLIAA